LFSPRGLVPFSAGGLSRAVTYGRRHLPRLAGASFLGSRYPAAIARLEVAVPVNAVERILL
jgi:hypothetical protein